MATDPTSVKEASEKLNEYSDEILSHVQHVQDLELSPELRTSVESTSANVKEYVNISRKIVDQIQTGAQPEEKDIIAFDKIFEDLEGSLEQQGELIEKAAEAKFAESEHVATRAMQIGILFFLIGGLTFAISAYINRQLVKELKTITEKLNVQTDQIGNSSQEVEQSSSTLSGSVSQQASALQETASSLEEINSMIRRTSENSTSLKEVIMQSSASIDKGQSSIRALLNAMNQIHQGNENVHSQIEESNKQIQEGSTTTNECGEIFESIIGQIADVNEKASGIIDAIGEQSKGLNEINQAVGTLNESVQTSETAASGNSKTARELLTQFESLGMIVSNLRQIVEGSTQGDLTTSKVVHIKKGNKVSQKAA